MALDQLNWSIGSDEANGMFDVLEEDVQKSPAAEKMQLRSKKKLDGSRSTGASHRKILSQLMNNERPLSSTLAAHGAKMAAKKEGRAVETRTKTVETSTTMADMEQRDTDAAELQQTVQALEGEKAELGEQLEQMTKRKADWEAEGEASLKAAKGEAETAKAALAEAQAAEAATAEQGELLLQKAQAAELALQSAQEGAGASDEQVGAAKAEAETLKAELAEAQSTRASLEAQLEAAKAEVETTATALETQRTAVLSSSELEQGLQQQMQEALLQVEALKADSASVGTIANDATAKVEQLTAELTAESGRHAAATERLATAEANAAAAETAHAETQAALTAQLEAESAAHMQTDSKLQAAEKALTQATEITVAQAAHVSALAAVGRDMAANPIEAPGTPQAIRDIRNMEIEEVTGGQQQLMTDVQCMANAVNELKAALESQQKQNGMLVANNAQLQIAADAAGAAEAAAAAAAARQLAAEAQAKAAEDNTAKIQERLATEERLRVHLHNMIQQLKGNIRVCVRVRPLIGDEAAKSVECDKLEQLSFPDDLSVEVSRAQATVTKKIAKKNLFTYDKTFNQVSNQESVFGEVSEFVQSAIDGKRVCVFCYGITGSGKTYTMGTDVGDLTTSVTVDGVMPEQAGIVPRTIKHMFDTLATDQSATVTVTCLEVYNEQVRDLFGEKKIVAKAALGMGSKGSRECAMPGMNGGRKKDIKKRSPRDDTESHKIDSKTGEISNLVSKSFGSTERVELASMLENALSGRSVSATACNKESSRAHTVISIQVKRKTEHGIVVDGELNLVDLAGSERVSKSGATGDRAKETQAINASLSALGDVVSSMNSAKAGNHVPYRNSKLTHVLQKCLGSRDAKILMFINVSPFPGTLDETTNSLRFASKVYAAQSGSGTEGGASGGAKKTTSN